MSRKNSDILGEEKISRLIPKMAVPTIIAQLITTFYNLVDTFFVSKLGTNATAAVGVNNSMERFIMLFATLIGAGASAYISIQLGQGKKKEADRTMSTSLITGFMIGVIVAIMGKLFLSPLVDFLGATPECKTYSMQYGDYVLLAAPFIISSMILNMILRSEGSSTFAMIGMGFGGILNCVLDPLFIFNFNLGVQGASMATAISKFVSFAILMYPYIRKHTVVDFSFRHFKIVMEDAYQVISIGMSSFMRTIFSVIATVMINRIAGSYSTSALAAVSVATRVMMFPFSAVLGFSMGFQPVCGYNWGARKYNRVKESFGFTTKFGFLGALTLGLLIIIFARPLVGLFNSENDLEIYRLGALAMRAEAAMLPMHATGAIITMFYSAVAKPGHALALSTARQGTCFLPLLLLLPRFLGVEGLCICQGAADVLSGAIIIPMFFKARRIIEDQLANE